MADKIYGLLGRKLGHSWSVPIHNALGCEDYRLIELEPDELGAFLQRPDIGGLNVTIPYKRDVMAYCDVIDEATKAIGSVNTIVRREDGKLCGYNTDAAGFRWLAERTGIDLEGRKVLILGSGGASLTVQAAARTAGAGEVVVVSRSGPNNYNNLVRHIDAEIIVNATPVGMYPNNGEKLIDLEQFPQCCGVLDLIYNPRWTAMLVQAKLMGIPCSGGLPMLVAQAVAAEELFFGKKIPVSENERIHSMLIHQNTNIVLIGMPGAGKTTIGNALAKMIGREAIDIDDCILERTGRTSETIIREDGEPAFREIEHQVTADIGKMTGKIILTGGGVIKIPRNFACLHQNGRVYHLLRDLDKLPTDGRPLSQITRLETMWEERKTLYSAFRDLAVDNNGTIENSAATIWREFCENTGS